MSVKSVANPADHFNMQLLLNSNVWGSLVGRDWERGQVDRVEESSGWYVT